MDSQKRAARARQKARSNEFVRIERSQRTMKRARELKIMREAIRETDKEIAELKGAPPVAHEESVPDGKRDP